jgi:transposase
MGPRTKTRSVQDLKGEFMGKSTKRHYTLEYKEQAVELASRIGVSRTARQLGVGVSSVHQWKKNADKDKPSNKNQVDFEQENRRLQKENEELKKVNYILKRAAAFFSQDHLK